LCRVHLFDWLEQVPRSRLGWGYRRAAYRQMAERLARISHRPLAVSCERASGRDQDLRRAPAWVLWLLGRATE